MSWEHFAAELGQDVPELAAELLAMPEADRLALFDAPAGQEVLQRLLARFDGSRCPMTAKTNPFDLLAASLLGDPAVKAAYDALEGEYKALRLKLTGEAVEAPQKPQEGPKDDFGSEVP